MAYLYTEFDGVDLPLFNHSQEHALMSAEPTLLDSIGGTFDWYGSTRRKGRKQIISLTGLYMGETEYLADHSGELLVDESGNNIIAGAGIDMLLSSLNELGEKKGVRGSLWRKRLADEVLQWKTARLLNISWPRVWEDHALKAELTCQFETAMEFWRAASATSDSASVAAGDTDPITVENTGQTVDDATITVTRSSGTITAFNLTQADLGIDLDWTGSFGSGSLVIDCGARTVKTGTTDAYSGLSLGAGHTAAGWCPISQGTYVFLATVTGGAATVTLSFYEQHP